MVPAEPGGGTTGPLAVTEDPRRFGRPETASSPPRPARLEAEAERAALRLPELHPGAEGGGAAADAAAASSQHGGQTDQTIPGSGGRSAAPELSVARYRQRAPLASFTSGWVGGGLFSAHERRPPADGSSDRGPSLTPSGGGKSPFAPGKRRNVGKVRPGCFFFRGQNRHPR